MSYQATGRGQDDHEDETTTNSHFQHPLPVHRDGPLQPMTHPDREPRGVFVSIVDKRPWWKRLSGRDQVTGVTYGGVPMTLTEDHRAVYLWTALIVIVLTLFAAFSIEAMLTEQTCISAATIDEAGTVVSTPVVCTP